MVYIGVQTIHCGFNVGGGVSGSVCLEGAGPRGIGCVCRFDALDEDTGKRLRNNKNSYCKVALGINGATHFTE